MNDILFDDIFLIDAPLLPDQGIRNINNGDDEVPVNIYRDQAPALPSKYISYPLFCTKAKKSFTKMNSFCENSNMINLITILFA